MRISGLVIFVLLALVGGFVYLGYSNPDVSFRTQVNVAVPIDAAFSGFTNDERLDDWTADLIRVKAVRGEPNTVGSVTRLTLIEDGREVIVTREIVAFEENQRVAFDLDQSNMTTSVDVLFEPTAAGSSIAAYHTVRGKGLFWRAILSLTTSDIQAQRRADFARLRAMLEAAS